MFRAGDADLAAVRRDYFVHGGKAHPVPGISRTLLPRYPHLNIEAISRAGMSIPAIVDTYHGVGALHADRPVNGAIIRAEFQGVCYQVRECRLEQLPIPRPA